MPPVLSHTSNGLAQKKAIQPTWVKRNGMFMVRPGLVGLTLYSQAYEQLKKFVTHYEKLGGELQTAPCFQIVPEYNVKYKPAGNDGEVALWVPDTIEGLAPDHPSKVEDGDQYDCWAWFTLKHKKPKAWIPDAYIEKHGLPKGFTLGE